MAGDGGGASVRMITAAPEVDGVMDAISELNKRGVVFSIGHRRVLFVLNKCGIISHFLRSIATSDIATRAVQHGARLITHLFNAMPQLHHRDPSIIGLLGASPHLSSPFSPSTAFSPYTPLSISEPTPSPGSTHSQSGGRFQPNLPRSAVGSEAFDYIETPPQTPILAVNHTKVVLPTLSGDVTPLNIASRKGSSSELRPDNGQVANMAFERPFYEMIVDGIHSHPNSVRVSLPPSFHESGSQKAPRLPTVGLFRLP